jgi:hypothetical protein
MSYFDLPRLYFSGTFFTDPSTVNNDSNHFLPYVTRPAPWQTPYGQHRFRFPASDDGVRIVGVEAGSLVDGADDDPIVGATVTSTDHPSPAKIVDLDVCQQAASVIYGLRLRIGFTDEQGRVVQLEGELLRPALNGVYFTRIRPTRGWEAEGQAFSYGDDGNAAGSFQARFRVEKWPDPAASPLLRVLQRRAAVGPDGKSLLSLRMELDGYQNVETDKYYLTGRVVGAIGPVLALDEPEQTPGERWLEARPFSPKGKPWYYPFLYRAPFKVDVERSCVVLDLSHAVSVLTFRGDPVTLGNLTLHVDTPNGRHKVAEFQFGAMEYTGRAMMIEVPVAAKDLPLLTSGPVTIETDRDDLGERVIGWPGGMLGRSLANTLWAEAADGISWAVDRRVFRLSGDSTRPDSRATALVAVRRWGRPLSGHRLSAEIVSVVANTPGNTSPNKIANTPQAEGALKASVTPTDASGYARVDLSVVRDPGYRTEQLDGQLYFVYINGASGRSPGDVYYEHQISVLAWSNFQVSPNPSWEQVAALMAVYSKLFPAMREKVELTDEHSFGIFASNPPWERMPGGPPFEPRRGFDKGAIPFMMTLPIDDPRYMPLTRDLSPQKVDTVLNWIRYHQPQALAASAADTPGGTR